MSNQYIIRTITINNGEKIDVFFPTFEANKFIQYKFICIAKTYYGFQAIFK